jgi:hypothetical protein
MTAKLLVFETRRERNRKRVPIGPHQLNLVDALWLEEENCFRSLSQWYQSPFATGCSRESRRQSCWSVIGRVWAPAKRNGRGRCECALTQAGRDIIEGRVKTVIRWQRPEESVDCPSKGVIVPFEPVIVRAVDVNG